MVMDHAYLDMSCLLNMSWSDADFDQVSKFHMLAFHLDNAQALLRAKLGRAQLELSHLLPPTPAAICDQARFETELYHWLQYDGETSAQLTSFQAVRSENLDEWQRSWRLDRFRLARWQEIISLLRQSYLWVGRLVSMLIDRLTRPLFSYQIIRRERAWSLLHGSHPPREDAGISRPAFAEPGRVCCEPAC